MAFLAGLAAALIAAAPGPAPDPDSSAPAEAAEVLPAEPEGPAADAGRVRERTGRILAGREYQRELPHEPDAPAPLDVKLPWLRALLRLAAYLGAAALLVVVAAWLLRRLRPASRDVEVLPPPAAAPVEIPIASAEALAAAGRYGAAIHALLLDTLAALSRAARLAPSLTSREIVARVALPEGAREALAGLVVAVEVSHFGGAEPGEAEYRACLDRFHLFLSSYRRAA